MENTIKHLEELDSAARRAELSSMTAEQLKSLAKTLRITVHSNSNPDKDTLVYAINSWFNI